MQRNRNEKTTSDFIEVNGFGTIATTNGYRDTFVYGYFTWGRWTFIVHQSLGRAKLYTVSEASTGYSVVDGCYSIEDALYYGVSFIEDKQYQFPTVVGNALVKSRCNLFNRNSCLQTLAIDTALWL